MPAWGHQPRAHLCPCAATAGVQRQPQLWLCGHPPRSKAAAEDRWAAGPEVPAPGRALLCHWSSCLCLDRSNCLVCMAAMCRPHVSLIIILRSAQISPPPSWPGRGGNLAASLGMRAATPASNCMEWGRGRGGTQHARPPAAGDEAMVLLDLASSPGGRLPQDVGAPAAAPAPGPISSACPAMLVMFS
jgi:hypothetical protein